jgi:catechol 2,3-dioxygenase-like lactoylglutathione lyase family enzyme
MSSADSLPSEPRAGGRAFGELLAAPKFEEAAERLALDFRRDHGFPPLYQLGLVVPDVEAAIGDLDARGVRGFAVTTGRPETWEEDGESKSFSGKLALAAHAGLELELLEPGEGSEFYRAGLDPDGAVALHHLGFLVPDIDVWTDAMTQAGQRIWVRGSLVNRRVTVRFAYVDSRHDAGIIVEFISVTIGGRPVRRSLLGLGAHSRR